jgi:hypothetical protein
VRRNQRSQRKIFLKVNDQASLRLTAHFRKRLDVLLIVDCDADEIGTLFGQLMHLLDGRINILRVGGAHALHGDGRSPSDSKVSYLDFTGV